MSRRMHSMAILRNIARYSALLLLSAIPLFYIGCLVIGTIAAAVLGARVTQYPQRLLQLYGTNHWSYLPYAAIPQCAREGIVSVEDKRFFTHPGIDPFAVLRVAASDLMRSPVDQGGSTITFQLARRIIDTTQPVKTSSAFAKYADILSYTLALEHDFTKQRILELYLNSVYFGRNATGFAQASEAYFNVAPSALSLAQCLYLTGLPQSPSTFGNDPRGAAAHDRYLHVLSTMERNSSLTAAEMHRLSQMVQFLR